jgi:glutamyl-tRNA(Gln) amidotransferase subunit E
MNEDISKNNNVEYYNSIGFRCGLEIHQRLATSEKLFCSCTAENLNESIEAIIERRQRAVAGEMGHVDRSTMFESKKQRSFFYNIFQKGSCLVDIDEEPPHKLNMQALQFALEISAAMHAEIPDEIQIMRKEVVDGSDPSAFQRTMLISYNGILKVSNLNIKIPSIFLEEESSGIAESNELKAIYNINRLGVPLIEIDTDSWISCPADAEIIAKQIGLLLRITTNVMRGIGSIRQDVNVSISGGTRVEIKGVQELDTMKELIENEVHRQQTLIAIKQKLLERQGHVSNPVDITHLFKDTQVKIIKNILDNGSVYGMKLEGFAGILGIEVMPDRRFGTEISDYVKSSGIKGIIHSDEDLQKYEFSQSELLSVKELLGIQSDDAFIIIAGSDAKRVESAIQIAKQRAEYALLGVPPETRAADPDSPTSRFMRFLPGGSRMYPETDAMPIETSEQEYKKMLENAVDVDSVKARLHAQIKNDQLADQMLLSQKFEMFNKLVANTHAEPILIATILLERMKELKREGIDADSISESTLIYIFNLYSNNKITKSAIVEILKHVPKNVDEVEKIINDNSLKRLSEEDLREIIEEFKDEKINVIRKKIMEKYRNNVDGSELNRIIGG